VLHRCSAQRLRLRSTRRRLSRCRSTCAAATVGRLMRSASPPPAACSKPSPNLMCLWQDPRILPCLHSFCSRCVPNMLGHDGEVHCDECGVQQSLDSEQIRNLPADGQLESQVHHAKAKGASRCGNCERCGPPTLTLRGHVLLFFVAFIRCSGCNTLLIPIHSGTEARCTAWSAPPISASRVSVTPTPRRCLRNTESFM
jgi:hypothetical protein